MKYYNKSEITFENHTTCIHCDHQEIVKHECMICVRTFYVRGCQDDVAPYDLHEVCSDCEKFVRKGIDNARKFSKRKLRQEQQPYVSPDAEFERKRFETMGAGIR